MRVGFVEIYMERVRDLLMASKTNLQLRETVDGEVYIQGTVGSRDRLVQCARACAVHVIMHMMDACDIDAYAYACTCGPLHAHVRIITNDPAVLRLSFQMLRKPW